VSYNDKHNEANGEGNRDGESHNRSWNCGVEGPTADPEVRALRQRQKRNLLATLFFSQGLPMLVAGDETGRTQRGNNNAYCQDNEIGWVDWNPDEDGRRLLAFVQRLSALRRRHPLFRRRTFFAGRPVRVEAGGELKDIAWLNPEGREMSDEEWNNGFARCLGVYLSGHGLAERDERGQPILDDDLVLLLNAHHEAVPFAMPGGPASEAAAAAERWEAVLDTSHPDGDPPADTFERGARYPLAGRALALLRRRRTA
jgi:glycogen operon protein